MSQPLAPARTQMADIARLAGYSVSTVSRALNGCPSVNARTRQRITELARSLHYTVNEGAKNLRHGRSRTVSVVVTADAHAPQPLTDPWTLALIGAVADELSRHGLEMLLTQTDVLHADTVARAFDSGQAQGVLVIGWRQDPHALNQLVLRQVPLVVWGTQRPDLIACTVGSDDYTGGHAATAHLLAQGRRRIGFVGDTGLPEVARRREGYGQALATAGLAVDPGQVCVLNPSTDTAQAQIQAWLSRGNVTVDAIVAGHDVWALATLRALAELGLRSPQDVAVVGYGDLTVAQQCQPALSSITLPVAQAGEAMVKALLQLVRGEHPRAITMPTALVQRHSSSMPMSA